MPRKYKRKPGVVPRHINWTEENLALAFEELDKNQKGINEISRIYGIPSRTLRRRYEKKNQQLLTQGKYPVLGFENEKRLVAHIVKLGSAGFPPERTGIRKLAYQFAEMMGLKHNFNNETKTAGRQWLQSFLERNPEIVLRQAEGLSIERAKGLNRAEVAKFFELLTTILTENDLLDKPDRIFNMDEIGIQLNNKPGKVLAKKGTRTVKSVTSGEKGETITVVACCNAIGNFLPPVLIIKGVNKKPEFEEGLPPCSKVYMQKKSAYISSDLFYRWLTEHFIPRKPPGKVLLILDSHSSHSSAVNMLETARDNDVVLLCLPSHTTSALQPLDISVFGPFKKYYSAETNSFMRTNPHKKLTRYNSGHLIANAWIRAAIPANAISGFRGSGIYPVNPNALSDAEFAISDHAITELAQEQETSQNQVPALEKRQQNPDLNPALNKKDQTPSSGNQEDSVLLDHVQISGRDLAQNQQNVAPLLSCQIPRDANHNELKTTSNATEQNTNQDRTPPRPSSNLLIYSQDCLALGDIDIENYIFDGTELSFPSLISLNENQSQTLKETPSKFLHQSSPIPKIPLSMSKRAKQSAENLNSNDKIDQKKIKEETVKKTDKATKTKITTARKKDSNSIKNKVATTKKNIARKRGRPQKKMSKKYIETTSSETESDDIEIELEKEKGLSKRKKQIHNFENENEEIVALKISKGKATDGIPIKGINVKKSIGDIDKTFKEKDYNFSIENTKQNVLLSEFCAECFENYNITKSKSDWIQCEVCRLWLHETCTTFKYHCKRCGNLKTLASSNNLY